MITVVGESPMTLGVGCCLPYDGNDPLRIIVSHVKRERVNLDEGDLRTSFTLARTHSVIWKNSN